jgi:hypothetical protein
MPGIRSAETRPLSDLEHVRGLADGKAGACVVACGRMHRLRGRDA